LACSRPRKRAIKAPAPPAVATPPAAAAATAAARAPPEATTPKAAAVAPMKLRIPAAPASAPVMSSRATNACRGASGTSARSSAGT
jgi:hypothetical protein